MISSLSARDTYLFGLTLVVQDIHLAKVSQRERHLAGCTAHPKVSFGSFAESLMASRTDPQLIR
jgi:hypothetical protein